MITSDLEGMECGTVGWDFLLARQCGSAATVYYCLCKSTAHLLCTGYEISEVFVLTWCRAAVTITLIQ
jgi:hypothetical protein